MTLYVIEPTTRAAGAIVVCESGQNNNIAEFFHNEHATVDQTYEQALALATDFTKVVEFFQAVEDAAIAIHGLLENPGDEEEWVSIRDLLPKLQSLLEQPPSTLVPRTEEHADAAAQATEASVLKDRDGEASARAEETEENCRHCASEPEPGWIETDNNGPIVRCGICNGTGLSHPRTEPASPSQEAKNG